MSGPSDLAYQCNPHVAGSAAPPCAIVPSLSAPFPRSPSITPDSIPLAAQWAAKYTPTHAWPLINLAQGVPGDPPPQEFMLKLAEAAADPQTTGYGDLRGDAGLRRELARDVNTVYGVKEGSEPVGEDDIVLTAGCNLAFYSTMIALARPGDEIILPTPWYFNNEMVLRQLGLTLVSLTCAPPSFLPSPTDAERLITARTRAIVLVTPNNPTGAVCDPERLRGFADLAVKHRVPLVLDETYREFVTGRPHGLFAETEWRSYLVHMFSFSKSYAIPGHRLGALVASPRFLAQINKTLDCLQICPARPAQQAVEWAVEATRPWREEVRAELVQRQRLFRSLLEGTEGWEVETGSGYFAYVKHPFPGASSELVASRLGEHVGVVVLPGTFFSPPFADVHDDRYIRFSIANVSNETLKKVPERLTALNRLWPSLSD
ncbi:SPOSA6832_00879, partial [Sporobolomyces salmonicolor]